MCWGLSLIALGAEAAPQGAKEQPSRASVEFTPSPQLSLPDLEQLVAARSSLVVQAEGEVDLARAEQRQSHLWENPVLDGAWDTIPIGELNPPGLERPLDRVPNYSVGLSYTFLLGKRGPRQERAAALLESARLAKASLTRQSALELSRVLGEQASILLRMEGLRSLAEEGAEALLLAEARVDAQFGVPLEADRLRIEVERTRQLLLDAEGDLYATLAECSSLLSQVCRPFGSTEAAKQFLSLWIEGLRQVEGEVEQRPDIRQLDAERAVAKAELAYARALSIPDPTVRIGYVHDRFLFSGNQMNSVNVGVSLPLPVFDRGQAQKQAADARHRRASELKRQRVLSAESSLKALRSRIELLVRQQKKLQVDILPRARAVLLSLEKAAEGQLVPMTDVLQARRTLSELLLEEAENYRSAFEAALHLAAELPSVPSGGKP